MKEEVFLTVVDLNVPPLIDFENHQNCLVALG